RAAGAFADLLSGNGVAPGSRAMVLAVVVVAVAAAAARSNGHLGRHARAARGIAAPDRFAPVWVCAVGAIRGDRRPSSPPSAAP
ncbi:hypothetical protein, partial [Nocardia sp. 852002-51101_SCH5132738]|uniref:hypothetical protein n=1 Tax=Nocardia sp. 852002-51101_SCH5132738 TaxID=1834095 RepID=UPI001E5ACB7E